MFSLGIVIVVVSILRIRALTFTLSDQNPSWNAWAPILWSDVEVYVSVICACLPDAKVFFHHLLSAWLEPKPRDWNLPTPKATSESGILKTTSITVSSPQNDAENDIMQLPSWESGINGIGKRWNGQPSVATTIGNHHCQYGLRGAGRGLSLMDILRF